MKTTKNQNQSNFRTVHQEISQILEEIKMKLHITTSTIKIKVSKVLASKAPVRVLGGFALAAMLMTATALPLSPVHADEATRPVTNISYEQQMADLLASEGEAASPARAVGTSYNQQIRDLLAMESEFTSPARVVGTSYNQQIRDLLAMESQFTSPAKVVGTSYDQQIADLMS